MKIALKEHKWVKMTMQDVEVIGTDPETGEPFGLGTGETRVGINCGRCGAPFEDQGECVA